MLRPVALALTILTGFSGLVYEVAWQKYVATLLGSHSEATAAILGIFLAGLSAGYSLFGRVTAKRVERAAREQRSPRLFRLYALVEGGIGLYALFFPWFFDALQRLSFSIPHGAEGLGFAIDVVLVALLVGPSTLLMGGTIPILTQALSTSLADATRFHALVYGTNTVGAFIGAVLGTFFLIPALGLHDTMRWMAVVNIGVAIAFALFGSSGHRVEPRAAGAGAPRQTSAYAALALVGLLTGFAMMVLQNVSIRLGGLVLGSSEYTFGMIVAVFVLCIAVGSLLVSLFPRIPPIALMANQTALLAYSGFLYLAVEPLPAWALYLRIQFGIQPEDFLPYQLACFAGAALLLGPAALLSGATLPLLFHHLRGRIGDLGAVAGAIYSWNTAGSFLGALLGGYALLYVVDLHDVFRIAMTALAASVALLVWQLVPRQNAAWAAGVLAGGLAVVVALPPWNPEQLTLGLFRQRTARFDGIEQVHAAIAERISRQMDKLIFHEDDPIATVTVKERTLDGGLSRAVMINGKGDGETGVDYPTMALAGLIPAMMTPKLERAFVVGFGTGVTAGELASLSGVEEVLVAEISPGVLRAAPLFDFANLQTSSNAIVRMIRGDAYRAFLRSEGRYDVIVSVPSNPWTTGVEMLFSAEFLRAARSRLSPGGIYVQWYHQYETDDESVALVLRTFASVFDRVAVWYGRGGDFLILGLDGTMPIPDLDEMRNRAMRDDMRAGLRRSGVEGFAALLAHELIPAGVVSSGWSEGSIHTLFRPILNHVAGRAFFRGASGGLPPLQSGASARAGVENSLLRRHLESLPHEPATRDLIAATEEACRHRLRQCLVFLTEVIRREGESDRVAALVQGVYSGDAQLRVGGAVGPKKLQSVARIAIPESGQRSRPASLAEAKHATHLYRSLFHPAVPFDPEVLADFWRRCRAPRGECDAGLREARSLDWRASATPEGDQ